MSESGFPPCRPAKDRSVASPFYSLHPGGKGRCQTRSLALTRKQAAALARLMREALNAWDEAAHPAMSRKRARPFTHGDLLCIKPLLRALEAA